MLAYSPDHVPLADDLPRTPVQVTITRDGETHIIDRQYAADVIHRVFPLAPIPMRIEATATDPDYLATFGTDWMVDLDAGSYQAAGQGVWMRVQISDPFGTIEVEVPQP